MALEKEEFARRLIQLRERHDPPLNKDQAARFIGTDPRHYHRWERAETMPYLSTIAKIANAYGIDTSYLIVDETQITGTSDLARIERKLNLILRYLNIDPDAEPAPAVPPPPPELVQPPPTRQPKRPTRHAPRSKKATGQPKPPN